MCPSSYNPHRLYRSRGYDYARSIDQKHIYVAIKPSDKSVIAGYNKLGQRVHYDGKSRVHRQLPDNIMEFLG